MKKIIITLSLLSALFVSPAHAAAFGRTPVDVAFETSHGRFVISLAVARAPLTAKNFIEYVENDHYNGTVFHRVIPGFVAQAGGFDTEFNEKTTRAPIANEAGNGLSNTRGTVALARTNAPHSGTSQFYINLKDNLNLDPSQTRWGYAVFGQVTSGMDVIDKIAAIPTHARAPFRSDVPKENVVINKAYVVEKRTQTK